MVDELAQTDGEAVGIERLDACLDTDTAHHGIAMYVHIPFCQALCTFCGLNVRIARNHSLATPYVSRLLSELEIYGERLERVKFNVGALHLGEIGRAHV